MFARFFLIFPVTNLQTILALALSWRLLETLNSVDAEKELSGLSPPFPFLLFTGEKRKQVFLEISKPLLSGAPTPTFLATSKCSER